MPGRNKLKLTKTAVETRCRLPEGRRQAIYWDTEIPGFGLRVGQRTRTYILQRDLPGGRTRRVTIGRHGAWTVQQARKKARELIARIDEGEDPNATRRARAARGVTLRQALDIHLRRLEAKDASERTKETLQDEVPRHLGDWLDRPLIEIRRQLSRDVISCALRGRLVLRTPLG